MAASPFRPAIDLMAQYASYHRDRRNIATHFLGIPLIVFAAGVLLARIQFEALGLQVNGAWAVWGLSTAWYLTRGNLVLGLAVSAANGLLMALAEPLAAGSSSQWLAWGLGSFVLGWIIQFVGHYYEGRKPAFVDDLIGLFVAPMFVLLELLAPAGFFKGLMAEVERQAGPTLLRNLAHPTVR